VGFAAIGVYVEDDRFRIRIKQQPHSPWQDWQDGRTCSQLEALDMLTNLGLDRTRAAQMIEFARTRGAPAPQVQPTVHSPAVREAPALTGRPGRCPSCDVPALAASSNGTGYFCLACGYTSCEAS